MKKRRIEIHTGLEGLAERIAEIIHHEENERYKNPVGKISESLKTKYLNWQQDNEDFIDEVSYKKDQLEKAMYRELDSLFKKRGEAIADRKDSIWASIRLELNLPDDTSLNFDPDTGIISEWVEDDAV